MVNYIDEYYQKIKSGEIVVGKWTLLVYEYLIHGLEHKLFYFSPKKADNAIRNTEKFTHHHEGALAPGRVQLELWQKAMSSAIYGIVDEDGRRQFREVVIIIGRKNGKTLDASSVALNQLFFDDEYGARVYFCAPKLDQAALCYTAFQHSIEHEPMLSKITSKRRTDVFVKRTNSLAKTLAFNAKKTDGLNVSCAICDEFGAWPGDQGLKFYEVLKSSTGAREEPLIISISTANYQNEGIYDELYRRSTRFLLGDSRETRLLPFIYQIDDIKKWNDINELKKANPNLGVSITRDFLIDEIAIAEGSLSKKAEFLTKYCNIKQNSSIAWLPADKIEACCGDPIDLEQYREHYAVCGIDLSQTTDLTSACVVIEKDGRFKVVSKFWMPRERVETATARDGVPYQIYVQRGLLELSGENFVDYKDCYNWMTELIDKYKIYPLQTGYDRYSAQYLVSDLKQYGFHCEDVNQGFNLTPVINEFEGLLKDGVIDIGDNDLLKIHLLNAALKFDSGSDKKRLVKVMPTGRIDGVAALLDAFTVRMQKYEEIGQQLKNER